MGQGWGEIGEFLGGKEGRWEAEWGRKGVDPGSAVMHQNLILFILGLGCFSCIIFKIMSPPRTCRWAFPVAPIILNAWPLMLLVIWASHDNEWALDIYSGMRCATTAPDLPLTPPFGFLSPAQASRICCSYQCQLLWCIGWRMSRAGICHQLWSQRLFAHQRGEAKDM